MDTDQHILQSLQNGDDRAFESLFRTYYSRLCNYSFNMLKDMDEAEEVTQQVFLNIWEQRVKLNVTSSFKAYLYKAVHNSTLNKMKQSKLRKSYAEHYLATESHPVIAEPAYHSELSGQIAIAIQSLPEQCRMVFKLSRFESMKYSEIATHLGISVKTVENHMGKALKLLRERLKDYLPVIVILLPDLLAEIYIYRN